MRDEGVTKYECIFREAEPPPYAAVARLIAVRNELFNLGWIGVYPDGIGFGNASLRIHEEKNFFITGTQTGYKAKLTENDICRVTGYDITRNRVECEGKVAASSESMTHAAVYALDSAINAVLHIHSRTLWQAGMDVLPTTAPGVAYGTPAMAAEMARLYAGSQLRETGVLIMAGHEEGVIAFGADLDAALSRLTIAAERLQIRC